MSSSGTLKDANRVAVENPEILWAFNFPRALMVLLSLYRDGSAPESVLAARLGFDQMYLGLIVVRLSRAKLLIRADRISLTPIAKARLDKIHINYHFAPNQRVIGDLDLPHRLANAYLIKSQIGAGATSFTFCAEQEALHMTRTLKIFRPGVMTYSELDFALAKRSTIQHSAIPEVIDAGQIRIKVSTDRVEIVPCVVLHHVTDKAQTLNGFLKAHANITSSVLERFIEQVGGALAAIEHAGLQHGDLHEGNILVTPTNSSGEPHEFAVIDFVGTPSTTSPELTSPTDIENFRDHLIRAAIIACERTKGYSANNLLGERVVRVLNGLREGAFQTFKDMLQNYRKEVVPVPTDHFQQPSPKPFEWLRVEWIPTESWLYRLFEPIYERFKTISRFGNTWISGPRGCGKSHYLRALAFHPRALSDSRTDHELSEKLAKLKYNFRAAFGVLFACRLGEFKGFTPEALGKDKFDHATGSFLKHILILKIWNRTLNTIQSGVVGIGEGCLAVPSNDNVKILSSFLEQRLGPIARIDYMTSVDLFRECLAVCTARENSAISVWHHPEKRNVGQILDERDLDLFFGMLRKVFSELTSAQFYILVDDASEGHICFGLQKILNSLVRGTHSNHCFKITCDKFTYTLDSADGRPIDLRHEATYVDLGEVAARSQRDSAGDPAAYMARVVNTRLKAADYTAKIEDILGDSQDVKTFLAALSLPRARRSRKAMNTVYGGEKLKAYYAGWNIVWQLSHGSVRSLLMLIEEIFQCTAENKSVKLISLKDQDKAVRAFSNRQFKALSMLPGELILPGERKTEGIPMGQAVQAVVSAIGQISRNYLVDFDTGEDDRWYETISVDRLDRRKLSKSAQAMLNELIKHGHLLDEGVTFSRSQLGLSQRYDLNKLFSPAFQTTYRVRNHLYLSHQRMEELLIKPAEFVARHRSKLEQLVRPVRRDLTMSLFGEENG